MAECVAPDPRRCTYFFLYDGSKVKGEGDLTREGICYFYPEETPLDRQELLCGQLAGVGRCVSELSSSAVRLLRLRRDKFAIRMKDDFFWALGCSVDVPSTSVCQLLEQLINLFCFYNGSVRQAYQSSSQEVLAARWAQYLSHLQPGSSELHHIFTCLKTIDATNVDPLLLLKAALILQACQRCPLVLAGCILFRGRVVSTQMLPDVTVKVMLHESQSYAKTLKTNSASTSGPFGGAVSSTTVFLTVSELRYLQSAPIAKNISSHFPPQKEPPTRKSRLSRTLSDVSSSESELSTQSSPGSLQRASDSSVAVSPLPLQGAGSSPPWRRPLPNGRQEAEEEGGAAAEEEEESRYHSFHSNTGEQNHNSDDAEAEGDPVLNGGGAAVAAACATELQQQGEESHDQTDPEEASGGGPPAPVCAAADDPEENRLVPMTLYLHRVKGLVLALLVEPHFLSDTAAMEEVYHSSLASLNGLEAHLRSVAPGGPAAQGPYSFAHFDCNQSTLATNLSAWPGGAVERPFVRAVSLLHSHFCNTETLQEAIIRSAGAAVYGTRSLAHETFFQQHSGSLRNSGIPNHQDSAFSLPSKARHRLLKHGVNLL
ncbi:BLOC-3 complex member HPS4 [Nelusetta ayraudi]|uniref:BLOC-3 complex member HPS4 n=1 Tax=Nelusetta ayraudi TaxID=303726 RepID=UPI003F71BDBF